MKIMKKRVAGEKLNSQKMSMDDSVQNAAELTKKRRKLVKIIVTCIAAVSFLFAVYFGAINLRFSIKEDLLINMPQRHIDVNASSQNPAELGITSSVQTSRLCTAVCTEKFQSVSSGDLLYEKKYKFKRTHKIEFKKTLYPYAPGEGQDIYVYSISCQNQQSANCPVKDSLVEKNSVITVSRILTPQEIAQKENQENLLYAAYMRRNEAAFRLDSSYDFVSQLKFAKTDDLLSNISSARSNQAQFEENLAAAASAWQTYNHTITEVAISNLKIEDAGAAYSELVFGIYSDAVFRTSLHNDLVNYTFKIQGIIADADSILYESMRYVPQDIASLTGQIAEDKSLLNYTARKIQSRKFSSYQELFAALDSVNASIDVFHDEYSSLMQNNSALSINEALLMADKYDSCQIFTALSEQEKGENQKQNEENAKITSNNSSEKSRLTSPEIEHQKKYCAEIYPAFNSSLNQSHLINYENSNYKIISEHINNICTENSELRALKIQIEKMQSADNNSNISLNLSKEEIQSNQLKHKILILSKFHNELLKRSDFSARSAAGRIQAIIDNELLANNLSAKDIPAWDEAEKNSTDILFFTPMNLAGNQSCLAKEEFMTPLNISFEQQPLQRINANNEKYNASLPKLLPRSCLRGTCEPYLNNPSVNYPIIVVHGHGFYTKNTKVTPSQVHNEFIEQLFEDNLYVPAGILKEDSEVIPQSLGHINAAFIYKASYYPDEILDNESISVFADRLSDIIEKAKLETGKDKVILVSHSMGGLVTRTYLKKYGTDDVSFAVIVGTPNFGVPSETVTLCKIFGRNLECDEMEESSSFITELKDEPEYNIPIYTLRGEGCATFGADGDGVVQSDKVALPYAKNYAFNGTCSSTGAFHVNLLSPSDNPKIYKKIKQIIQDNS